MTYVREFERLGRQDADKAGGKGASLGELARAVLPVPPGFVVLTTAYEAFIEASGIAAQMSRLLKSVDPRKVHSIETAGAELRRLVLDQHIPSDIQAEILQAFESLGTRSVAVRSSATAEDGSSAAWAGQLETYLNTPREELLEAVKRCWASLFTPRAIFYRYQQQLDAGDIAVAVVIQAMVDSEVAGIAFSVHPVSQDPNRLIIEAGWGQGEAVVSGQITPDSYIVQKSPLKLLDRTTQRQTRLLKLGQSAGSEWVNIPAQKSQQPKLDDKTIVRLSQLVLAVEVHYGFACDVEWALADGRLYLLQARPITTLNSAKQAVTLDEQFLGQLKDDKLMRFEGQFMPFQLMIDWWNYYDCELSWQGIYPVLFFFTPQRTTAFISRDKYRGIAVETFSDLVNGQRSFAAIKTGYKQASKQIQGYYQKYFVSKAGLNESQSLTAFRRVYKVYQELVVWTLFYEQLDESAVAEVLTGRGLDLGHIWQAVKLPAFTSFDTRKKELMVQAMEGRTSARYLSYVFSDYTFLADETFVSQELTSQNLAKLKVAIRQARQVTKQAKLDLNQILTSADDATKRVIEILQWVLFCRDERKDAMTQAELTLHYLAGRLFAEWGLAPELLAYCGITEIVQGRQYVQALAADLPKRPKGFSVLYALNRKGHVGYTQLEAQLERLDRVTLEQNSANAGSITAVHGEAGNHGEVAGAVHIILRREEFGDFKEGEILVTGMTRPEFVPLMVKAAGIITDEGGITSHAAIISRELDKPCLIGTKVATQVFKNGDRVHLDASRGIAVRQSN